LRGLIITWCPKSDVCQMIRWYLSTGFWGDRNRSGVFQSSLGQGTSRCFSHSSQMMALCRSLLFSLSWRSGSMKRHLVPACVCSYTHSHACITFFDGLGQQHYFRDGRVHLLTAGCMLGCILPSPERPIAVTEARRTPPHRSITQDPLLSDAARDTCHDAQ